MDSSDLDPDFALLDSLGPLPGATRVAPAESWGHTSGGVARIRASHHKIAQLLAQGLKASQVSAMTGYSPAYISVLRNSNPAFKELVTHYMECEALEALEIREKQTRLGEMAVDELTDRLAEDPQSLSTRELLEVIDSNLNRPRAADSGSRQPGGPPSPITIQFVNPSPSAEPGGTLIEGTKE